MNEIKKFEEQAIKRYYGESGIVDLIIGIISLFVSLAIYYKITFFGAIIVIMIFGLNRLLRKLILFPRLGYAEFIQLKAKKRKQRLIIFFLILLILGLLADFSFGLQTGHFSYFSISNMIILAAMLLVIGLIIYRILFFKIYHLFIYCITLLVISALGLILRMPNTLFWGGLVMCFLGLMIGLLKTVSFMKRYPVLVENDE